MHHDFIIYAGPDATGRVFHALIHARQTHLRGDPTRVFFAAEGTAWPLALSDPGHALHALFAQLLGSGVIAGTCENCAVAFGNTAAKEVTGLVRGPDASAGQIDIIGFADAGHRVWIF